MPGLTNKQRRFVEEYLVDLNATQAAIRAKYSVKTAAKTGHENVRKPEIASAIRKAMDERAKSTGLTAQFVIDGLMREAGDTMPDSTPSSRVAALGWLGKHLALFTERVENTGKDGGPIQVIERRIVKS